MIALLMRADRETWSHRALDGAFLWLVFRWVMSAMDVALVALFESDTSAVLIRHLAYQVSVAATLNFLRNCMSQSTLMLRGLVLLQLGIGAFLLVWGILSPQEAAWPVDMWHITNVLGFCRGVAGHGTFAFRRQPLPTVAHARCLPDGIWPGAERHGLGGWQRRAGFDRAQRVFCLLVDVVIVVEQSRRPLFCGRFRRRCVFAQQHPGRRVCAQQFVRQGVGAGPGGSGHRVVQCAPPHRPGASRWRGSQLVNLIATRDRSVPEQKEMAQALEECLLDVKMLGDGINDAEEPGLEGLGRLRYRVQPSLHRLGIALVWDMNDRPALDAFTDERVRQVLRIAQEAWANVMRHSRATAFEVSCVYVPEAEALMVSVSDNGIGMEGERRSQSTGKGVEGMRWRAGSIHGPLEISSKAG